MILINASSEALGLAIRNGQAPKLPASGCPLCPPVPRVAMVKPPLTLLYDGACPLCLRGGGGSALP